jgi:hypothetical protein
MLRGEPKLPFCSDDLVVRSGRKAEAVDSGGVDRSDDRSKEKGEEGTAMGVVKVEPVRLGKEEREIGVEDDRVVFDDGDW